jgi:signal transduction histidine kinase
MSIKNWLKSKTLSTQLLALCAFAMIVASLVYMVFIAHQSKISALELKYAEGQSIAAHLAVDASFILPQRNFSRAEESLKALSVFPDVQAARITSLDGDIISEVERDSRSGLVPTFRIGQLVVPDEMPQQGMTLSAPVQVWQPIKVTAERIGWVNVELNTDSLDAMRVQNIVELSLLCVLLIMLVLLSIYFLGSANLMDLRSAIKFARKISDKPGMQSPGEACSRELNELQDVLNQLSGSLQQRQTQLDASSEQLRNRIKQLNCIYMVTKVIADGGLDVEKKMSSIVKLLPGAMRYPEQTHAKIIYFGKEYRTENYEDCLYSISEALKVGKQYVGMIEINIKPDSEHDTNGGAFQFSEVSLLQEVASRVNAFLKQNEIQNSLAQLNVELDKRVLDRTFQLEEARHQAEQASKAKSEFLASMSHEFRTPINAIIGFTQFIKQDDGRLNPEQKEALQYISDAGIHMMSLIDNVLDLAKLESGSMQLNFELVDVGDVLEQVKNMLEPQRHSKDVSVETNMMVTKSAFPLDRQRFSQILINLMNNAIKYNRQHGQVIVNVREEAGMLKVIVKDTGKGITKENMDKLFEAFYRVSDNQVEDGIGVGLTVVKRLVELMSGTIEVESEVGAGSIFKVEIPIAN